MSARAIVHIVDESYRNRAVIAKSVFDCGGIAEIYETLDEVLEAKPTSGAILANFGCGDAKNLLAKLRKTDNFLPLIMFAEAPTTSQIVRAAHDGAADFLAWPFTGEDILQSCIYCEAFMEERGSTIVRQEMARNQLDQLTPREREILEFMVNGYSNKDMAKFLDLSPRTIEDYRLNTIKKLGVGATSAAIRIGLEAGLGQFSAELSANPTTIEQQTSR